MDAKRLQQITDYARALEQLAIHERGNIADTRDIVKALEELEAYQTLWMNICAQQRRVA